MEKTCNICQVIKNLEEFVTKNRVKKDGKAAECKECQKKRNKEYRDRAEVKERKKEYEKHYYENNKVLRDNYHAGWRIENKERKKEYDLEYRKENAEKIKQYQKSQI